MNRKLFKEIIFWLAIGIYLIVIAIFSSGKLSEFRYNRLSIIISDSTRHRFIDKNDILKILSGSNIFVQGSVFDSLNTLKLERLIKKKNNVIKQIDIYPTYHGTLFIRITQRNPILRIIAYNNSSFYIDEDGYLMPNSDKYISRVPIVTGVNINYNMFEPEFNAKYCNTDFPKEKMIYNLFNIASLLYNDSFWKKNIEQLVIKDENQLIIIPEAGNFSINFGDFNNMKNKIKYLTIMYKDVLPKVGWNKYSEINLSYNNQIVCTKK